MKKNRMNYKHLKNLLETANFNSNESFGAHSYELSHSFKSTFDGKVFEISKI